MAERQTCRLRQCVGMVPEESLRRGALGRVGSALGSLDVWGEIEALFGHHPCLLGRDIAAKRDALRKQTQDPARSPSKYSSRVIGMRSPQRVLSNGGGSRSGTGTSRSARAAWRADGVAPASLNTFAWRPFSSQMRASKKCSDLGCSDPSARAKPSARLELRRAGECGIRRGRAQPSDDQYQRRRGLRRLWRSGRKRRIR